MESVQDTWGRLVTLEEALEVQAPVVRITAPVAAGKTEYIVRKIAALVAGGLNPEKVLCVVSSPTAAFCLQDRLAKADEALAAVVVQTPLQMAVDILQSPEAFDATQRKPRLLCGAEFNMLLEDLKAQAESPEQIRSMLNKAFSGLGALGVQDSWGLDEAEADLYNKMLSGLRFLGAMLREEAPALAAAYLQDHTSAQGAYDAVCIDDAHNISEATYATCKLLTNGVLLACGNPNQAQTGFDRGSSIVAFESMAEEAECLQLTGGTQPAAIAAFCDALCDVGAMDAGVKVGIAGNDLPDEDALTCIKWHDPEDEFQGIGQMARTFMKEREGTDPGDIFVVVPNRAWAHAIAQVLEKRRVDTVIMMDTDPIVGNPCVEDSGTLNAYCRLALASDDADMPAWRLWCGLGHKSCRSHAWAAFKAWAEGKGLSAAEALREVGTTEDGVTLFDGAEELRARYQEGLRAVEDLSTRHGFALLKALTKAPGGQQVRDLLEPIEGNEDAAVLHGRLVSLSLEPYFIPDAHRVAIGSYKLIQGLDPRHIFACGLIEGYVPPITHVKLHEADAATAARLEAERRAFYNAVGKARETLVLSTVQRAPAKLAEQLRMDVRRAKREHGRDVAVLARSCFIDEAGDAAPSSVSGEQFLAEEE